MRLVALLWATLGTLLFSALRTRFHHYVAPAVPAYGVLVAMLIDDLLRHRARPGSRALLLLGAASTVPIAVDLVDDPARLLELVIYRYDRPWPDTEDLGVPLVLLVAVGAVGATILSTSKRQGRAVLAAAGLLTWLFVAGPYLRAAAPHWGQQAIARTYYRARTPSDPLVAWQLYWWGEVFWTHGRVVELRNGTAARLLAVVEEHPRADRVYVVTEVGRLEGLRRAVPRPLRGSFRVDDARSNKFVLASFRAHP